MTHNTLLPDRSIFTISGEEAAHFLQGLITNDIKKATGTQAIYACMLTPQGKYLCDFFIILWQGCYFLDVGTPDPAALLRKLTLYKLRSKVEIQHVSSHYQVAALAEALPSSHDTICYADPRHPALGFRAIAQSGILGLPDAPQAYETLRLSLGIPDGLRDLVAEESFPLTFNLEAFHAIDFKKGCYVGQEVTARTKYRGSVKKGLFRLTATSPLPAYGTPIMAGTVKLGELLSSQGNIGLALIRLEEWEKHKGEKVRVGEVEVTLLETINNN